MYAHKDVNFIALFTYICTCPCTMKICYVLNSEHEYRI